MTLVFGLEGQEGCKVAANIIHGFDCNVLIVRFPQKAMNTCFVTNLLLVVGKL